MKKVILLIVLASTIACKSQKLNAEFMPEGKKPYLIGQFDKSALQTENYNSWYDTNYNNYTPDYEVITVLKQNLSDYDIKLFMGTWCGDSKHEVPKFFKILEATEYPIKQLTAVALSREKETYKESPQHEEEGLNIVRVPTIIFFRNGKEVNRIIEKPIETLEKDMLNIITKNDYKPNYFGVKRKPKINKK
ncbi:TlpA family protein disulfide reductase [Winogradskyella litorisediminis]|uniref:TlpA family protein disulfide reductase n=1 Tax=Winogradskyella litorisediminis TaxID=1156618 RepID=A0ABW3N317_9FLAO